MSRFRANTINWEGKTTQIASRTCDVLTESWRLYHIGYPALIRRKYEGDMTWWRKVWRICFAYVPYMANKPYMDLDFPSFLRTSSLWSQICRNKFADMATISNFWHIRAIYAPYMDQLGPEYARMYPYMPIFSQRLLGLCHILNQTLPCIGIEVQ